MESCWKIVQSTDNDSVQIFEGCDSANLYKMYVTLTYENEKIKLSIRRSPCNTVNNCNSGIHFINHYDCFPIWE
jgi:hypothetical protein